MSLDLSNHIILFVQDNLEFLMEIRDTSKEVYNLINPVLEELLELPNYQYSTKEMIEVGKVLIGKYSVDEEWFGEITVQNVQVKYYLMEGILRRYILNDIPQDKRDIIFRALGQAVFNVRSKLEFVSEHIEPQDLLNYFRSCQENFQLFKKDFERIKSNFENYPILSSERMFLDQVLENQYFGVDHLSRRLNEYIELLE